MLVGVVSSVGAIGPARADESHAAGAPSESPDAPRLGRGLASRGDALVNAGIGRLLDALLGRIREGGDAEPKAKALLADKVRQSQVPALAAAYGDRFHFVGPAGLSPAGEALKSVLAEARLNGLDLDVPAAVTTLATAAPAPAPEVPSDAVRAAWEAAAGVGIDRLDAAAKLLAEKVPGLAPKGSLEVEARVAVEVALLEGLAQWMAQAAPVPRQEAVLADKELGIYLSPDTLWRGKAPAPASLEALQAALAAAEAGRLDVHLATLLPKHPQYAALVAAGRRYAGLCQAGGWKPLEVPATEKAARSADAVQALEERLAREGFYAAAPSGTWTPELEAAILEYRRVRQLKDKPLYDKDLVASLNVPCETRLKTLMLNARRWRFSAWNGEQESVQVNLAGQILRYFRDGQLIQKQRTVVGSDKSYFNKSMDRRHWRNATPILHDTIAVVIVNPEWNVPARIARDELEPEIAKDPTYLEKKGFRVVPGTNGGNYYIQASGPGNALGRIKILFPNDESVYLHDTPGRAAFNLPVRALSHGCVRVHNAVELGAELVRADKVKAGETFDPERIRFLATMTTKTWTFKLTQEVPVFLEYYTASVDDDGAIWFHPDIYGYDAETFGVAVGKP